MQGVTAVHDVGRDLRAHPAQPGRSHRADGARRRRGPRAVHVGAHAGQGPRLLHGLRPRRAHVEQPGLPAAGGERHRVGGAATRRAQACAAPEDAGGRVRRRLQRPELRAAQSGAASTRCRSRRPTPRSSSRRRPSSTSRCSRSEPDIVKPIAFNFDERGRLWVIETKDYPNEMLQRRAGQRPHQDPRGHQRRRQGRQVHGLRRRPQPADEPGASPTAASSSPPAPNFLFLKDTNGDDKADVRQVLSTGWGINDTPRRAVEPDVRARQLRLGHGRLLRLQRHDERQADAVRPGHVPLQAGRLGLRLHRRRDQQHVGPRLLARRSTCSARRPTTTRASTSRFRTATSRASTGPDGTAGGRRRARATRASRSSTPCTRSRRTSARSTCSAASRPRPGHQLYTARAFPKEYWNRIAFITEPTAHLVGQGVIEKQGSGFVTRDGWNLIAERRGVVRAGARAGRTGRRGVVRRLVQLHHPAQPDAAGLQQRPGNAYETSMRDKHARPHLPRRLQGRAGVDRQRSLSASGPGRALVAALADDNMFWRLHAQRLLVERGQQDVVPQLLALRATRRSTRSG